MRQIGFRVSAGYDYTEVALMLEANRDHRKHVELPRGPISATWIKVQMHGLRRELADTHTDLTQY